MSFRIALAAIVVAVLPVCAQTPSANASADTTPRVVALVAAAVAETEKKGKVDVRERGEVKERN